MASRFEEFWESAKKKFTSFGTSAKKAFSDMGDWLEDKLSDKPKDDDVLGKFKNKGEKILHKTDKGLGKAVKSLENGLEELGFTDREPSLMEQFGLKKEKPGLFDQAGRAADETINKAQDKLEDWQRARQKEQSDRENAERRERHKATTDAMRKKYNLPKPERTEKEHHKTEHNSGKRSFLDRLFGKSEDHEGPVSHKEKHSKKSGQELEAQGDKSEKGWFSSWFSSDKGENSKTHTAQHAKTSAKTGGQGRH